MALNDFTGVRDSDFGRTGQQLEVAFWSSEMG